MNLTLMSATGECHLNALDYAVIIAYLILAIAIGLFFSKKENDTEEYFLGGRRMPTFIIAVSILVTLFSAISFVAVPGEAFTNGLSWSIPSLLAPIGTIIGFSLFIRFYFRTKVFTPFQYLEERFCPGIRLFISITFLLMRLMYLGVVIYASAKVFKGAAGWSLVSTILIVGAVSTFYTTLGGMKAVVWTDFVQFLILVLGVSFAVWKLISLSPGGLYGIIDYSFSHDHGFNALKSSTLFSFSPYERFTVWLLTASMIANYTFMFGADQMTVQRLLSTSSYKDARKATLQKVLMALPFISVFWLIGLGLFTYYNTIAAGTLPAGITPSEIFSYFIARELPSPISGLLIAAMLAAVMSTADSGMNSLSAVFVKDIYKRFIHPEASTDHELRLSRIMTVAWGVFFTVFALFISFLSESTATSIFEAVGIWGALSCVAGGTFLLGVSSRRAHSGTIIVSSIASMATVIILGGFFFYGRPPEERIAFSVVGTSPFIVMLIVGYALCLIWPRNSKGKSIDGLTLYSFKKDYKNEDI
jgi:sodium-coupled monocarboxylate transporter 8/12